jgi:hypothetical protein
VNEKLVFLSQRKRELNIQAPAVKTNEKPKHQLKTEREIPKT